MIQLTSFDKNAGVFVQRLDRQEKFTTMVTSGIVR